LVLFLIFLVVKALTVFNDCTDIDLGINTTSRELTMKTRINFRFATMLLLAVAVLVATAFGLHYVQSARSSKIILAQARAAQEAGEIAEALRGYGKYCSLVTSDVEADVEYSNLLADVGLKQDAFFRLESILRQAPDQSQVRKRLVEIALDLKRGSDAKSHLEQHLLPADPENAELKWLMGKAERQMSLDSEALEDFQKAVSLDPRDFRFADSLADLLTNRLGKPQEAEKVLNVLIEQSPESPEARFVRARWLAQQGQNPTSANAILGDASSLLERAWQDTQVGLQLAPQSPVLAVLLAEVAVARNLPGEALPIVEKALAGNPQQPLLVVAAANLDRKAGSPERARKRLKEALQVMPKQPEITVSLAQEELLDGDDSLVPGLIEELRAGKYPEPQLRYIEAQWMAKRGRWRDAAKLLESVRPQLDRSPATLSQVDYLLGLCFQSMGNIDQEVVALRRALSANPNFEAARQELASALYRAGRLQEAAGEYWNVVRRPNPPMGSVLGLAQLLLVEGLRKDASQADWSQLEQLIGILKEIPEATAQVAILQAELQAVRGESQQSAETLQSALAAEPASAALNQAWISFCLRSRDWDKSEQALQAADSQLGDIPSLRLERARLEVLRSGTAVSMERLDEVAQPVEAWTEAQRVELASGMAKLMFSLGENDRAQRQAQLVADSTLGRNNIEIHLLMFELALRSGQLDAMSGALERVEQIEGQGAMWRVGKAIRYAVEADKTDAQDKEKRANLYGQALNQLTEAAVLRPAWAKIPQLQGEIMDRQDNVDAALQHYMNAISLGDKSPTMINRTIFLLTQQRRFLDADKVIRTLREQQTPFSSDLSRLATEVSLELENFDRALELAREAAAQSESIEDRVWLAQVYAITGQPGEAELELKKVLEQQPSSPLGWVSMIQFYSRQKDLESAAAIIQKALDALDPDQSADALAQCYELIMDYAQAEQYYQRAADKNPDDSRLARRVAEFYLSIGKSAEAQARLERLLNMGDSISEIDLAWARRALAMVLGLKGDQQLAEKARQLIDLNLNSDSGTVDDRRTKAFILSNSPSPDAIKEAVQLMEEVVQEQPQFSLSDNFMLANLYNRIGDWPKYLRTMRSVFGNGGAEDINYVRSHAEALLNRGDAETGEAKLWLERLKGMAPEDLDAASVEARLLFRSGDYARLIELLEKYGAEEDSRGWAAALADAFASNLSLSGQAELAEKLWGLAERYSAQLAVEVPAARTALVGLVAKRGLVERAIQMAADMELTPDELAAVGALALQSGGLSKQQAQAWIDFAQPTYDTHRGSVALGVSMADMYAWVEDIDQAVAAYRRVLEAEPSNFSACNNLAMVLALTGRDLELAMNLIGRLFERLGPVDYLLDTRGLVQLAARSLDDAEIDFRRALESSQRADKYFHLALVLDAMGRVPEARQAMELAVQGGLTRDGLHPLERPGFERISKLVSDVN
jgi:tetratricopeptide (TPR) repeat protein